MKQEVVGPRRDLAIQEVEAIAESLDIPLSKLIGRRQNREYVIARRLCFARLRLLGFTCCEIGFLFNRDHSTVSYAINRNPSVLL